MYKEFKTLVDKSVSTIEDCYTDNRMVCERLGIDITNGYSQTKVTEYLYGQIRANLETPSNLSGIKKPNLLEIAGDFINRYILTYQDPIEYLQVLNVIRDSCRTSSTDLIPFSELEKWELAIGFAKDYNLFINTHGVTIEKLRHHYPELVDRANSIKAIQEYGCTVTFDAEDIRISNAEKVFEFIEGKIKAIGGVEFLTILFDILGKNGFYSKEFDRYLLPSRKTTLEEDVTPEIPFGYLFNIAAKYPFTKGVLPAEKCFHEIVKISQLACNATYAVQHYSIWKYILHKGEDISNLVRDIAISDSIFTINQLNPNKALKLYQYLFKKIDKKVFDETFGFTANEYFIVIGLIWGLANSYRGPFAFRFSEIRKIIPNSISTTNLIRILDRASHKKNANSKYTEAADIKNVDYLFRPLIKLDDEKYILLQKSANVQGVFEVLATGLRSKFKSDELDSLIGKTLEPFLKTELRNKNISYTCGNYNVHGYEGEADLVVETDSTIAFFEIKKKVLTRAAKSGIDTSILIDLSESILDANLQSIRTELLLRQNGSINLTNEDGESYNIQLNNRKIEHICIAQMEFGSLHDRQIFTSFLTSILRYNFHPISKADKKLNSKFQELNTKGEILRKKYEELRAINPDFNKNPFFDHWFLSVNQLQEMIALSDSNSMLIENITMSKYSFFGTFDFYSEYVLGYKTKNQSFNKLAAEKGVTWVHGL